MSILRVPHSLLQKTTHNIRSLIVVDSVARSSHNLFTSYALYLLLLFIYDQKKNITKYFKIKKNNFRSFSSLLRMGICWVRCAQTYFIFSATPKPNHPIANRYCANCVCECGTANKLYCVPWTIERNENVEKCYLAYALVCADKHNLYIFILMVFFLKRNKLCVYGVWPTRETSHHHRKDDEQEKNYMYNKEKKKLLKTDTRGFVLR